MSSISSLSSVTSPFQTASQSGSDQFIKDFKALGSALDSGNLSAAQTALATFQQDLQGDSPNSATQSSSNQPFGKNSAANKDYQTLVSALQSGDTSGAQKAFASLQADLKGTQGVQGVKGHHHHHHHHSSATEDSTTSSTPSSGTVGVALNATA
jgi:hypothetical protein